MFAVFRTLVYASLFIGLFLVFIPGRILARVGITPVAALGTPEVVGLAIVVVGGALAILCVLTFAVIGKGTPAPFDPPRRLVIAGPYRYVRNPMYIGAALALFGAALFYGSWPLLAYTAAFLLITHWFVLLYEEPTLRRTFATEYEEYC